MIPIATITFPSTNAVTFVDNSAAFKNTGQHISGVSSFTATGHATVSGLAAGERVQYWLVMYAGSEHIFNESSDTQTFKIPTLSLREKKLVQYTYHVKILTDRDGWAIQTGYDVIAYQEAFTLDTYTPPALVSLSAERYSTRPTDTGTGAIDTRDNSGEYVRFSFKLVPAVTSVASNTYTLSVKATSDSGTTKQKASAYTGTTALTKTNDTTIFPAASFSFSAAENWTFTFTVTDKVTSVSSTCQVSKASAILDVEPGGVAIGGFLSEGAAFVDNNLILGSGTAYASTEYMIHQYTLSEAFQLNQDYTITVWGSLGKGKTAFDTYLDNSSNEIVKLALKSTGVYSATVKKTSWVYPDRLTTSTTLLIYARESSVTGVTTRIDRIKLEKGKVTNPVWTQNSQDHAQIDPFPSGPRFETSPDCGTILRGGLWDNLGYRMDYVNNTTILPIDNANFEPYSRHDSKYDVDAGDTMPMISRVGPIVFMEGVVMNKKDLALGVDGLTLTTLPGWARPRMRVSQLCQGTSTNIFWTHVEATGKVIISRYRNTADYGTATKGSQFQFTMSWLAADAAPPLPEYEE